jgi:prepilin-type N-terminal cleavage/methylation domain-containing protein
VSVQTRRRGGFTLIEIMAVVAMIGFVFFVALNFYTELARATTRASDYTRDVRRASAILDRVARDVEGAFLMVKPPEMDPIAFPWIFLGETRLGGDTSDRLKFITRNHDATRTEGPETNIATVAYITESADDDSVSLYRWSSPRLPESLDKNFPRESDEGTYLIAEHLRYFGFQFVAEAEEGSTESVRTEWDSSTLLESSSLPLAVEIQVSLMPSDDEAEEEPPVYRRRVLIPVRPIDLAALLDPNNPLSGGDAGEDSESEEEEEEGGGNCVAGSMTNSCCFPDSVPDSASTNAKLCVGLAKSKPDMPFTPNDYRGLPEECKPLVNPKCR